MIGRRVRLGMVGGAGGAFIGPVHAMAARLDGRFDIVAGAFSADADRSRRAAPTFGVDAKRAYADYRDMFNVEAERDDGIEAVSIVTPNHLHHQIAMAALDAGLHVMCDKPLAIEMAQAREIAARASQSDRQFFVSYTYSGYPLVREAQALVEQGVLGTVRKVVVTYAQGWLARAIENEDQKQAGWRTDPARAGPGGCVADIGVHAFHLAEFIAGLRVAHLCADLNAIVDGRVLDDDCNVLLRFDSGACGVLIASQVSIGEKNALSIRLYGDRGGLRWEQEHPNALYLALLDGTTSIIGTGDATLAPSAQRSTRLPGGHPEGYIEAFANIYLDFHRSICGQETLVPCGATGVDEAVRGMAFVDAAIRSGGAKADLPSWVAL